MDEVTTTPVQPPWKKLVPLFKSTFKTQALDTDLRNDISQFEGLLSIGKTALSRVPDGDPHYKTFENLIRNLAKKTLEMEDIQTDVDGMKRMNYLYFHQKEELKSLISKRREILVELHILDSKIKDFVQEVIGPEVMDEAEDLETQAFFEGKSILTVSRSKMRDEALRDTRG